MRLPEAAQAPPQEAVARAAVALGRCLRRAGLSASVDRQSLLCAALGEVDMRRRSQVYWAARAAFVQHPEQVPAFDRVFERFWAGGDLDPAERGSEHGESDPRMTGPQHGGESLPQLRHDGRGSTLVDGQSTRATREIPAAGSDERSGGERRGVLAAYSPAEVETEREAMDYAEEELLAVRRLAAELRRRLPERRSRRLRPSRAGSRLDVRRTLRRALATDGEPLQPAYEGSSRRPRRLLFLCDVSGSMERHSRVLLASMKAAVGAGGRTEAFVFATRLTRLTRSLGGHDFEAALERSRASVEDWSGGTRIGEVLAGFNATWGRRGVARGAIVVIVSDGWDRGDPRLLARELERLQLQARRLVWLNPRPAQVDEQPLAVGMRAAMPYVDDFVSGHDPRAVAELGRVIGGLGSGRPRRRSRRSRPVKWGER